MIVSDSILVRGSLDGDKAAFAELYNRRARLIRAICYFRTRDIAAAVDLAQEVFLRAYGRLDRLSDHEKFVPWLIGIARQVCREFRRQRTREGFRLARRAELERVRSSKSELQFHKDESLAQLYEAIALLPWKERLALHAYYLQDLDVEQARATLGLSRSGFYRVLSCARNRLRRVLSRAEVLR